MIWMWIAIAALLSNGVSAWFYQRERRRRVKLQAQRCLQARRMRELEASLRGDVVGSTVTDKDGTKWTVTSHSLTVVDGGSMVDRRVEKDGKSTGDWPELDSSKIKTNPRCPVPFKTPEPPPGPKVSFTRILDETHPQFFGHSEGEGES